MTIIKTLIQKIEKEKKTSVTNDSKSFDFFVVICTLLLFFFLDQVDRNQLTILLFCGFSELNKICSPLL